jgi:hypothetical protein
VLIGIPVETIRADRGGWQDVEIMVRRSAWVINENESQCQHFPNGKFKPFSVRDLRFLPVLPGMPNFSDPAYFGREVRAQAR